MRVAKHYVTPDRTVEELYQATLKKRMALLRGDYTVIEMWECQWDRLVDNEPDVSQFLRSFDLVPSLKPREAFFLVDGQARWLCMPWLGRVRKYATWMSPSIARGSTRTALTPSVHNKPHYLSSPKKTLSIQLK